MIDDLNRTPRSLIEEAREAQGFARLRLLRSRITHPNYPFLDRFIREVVDGDASPEEWGRGGILVPDLSISELLETSPPAFLHPLRRTNFSKWKYVMMEGAIDRHDPSAGAPAALYGDLHYSWRPPENVVRISPKAAKLSPAEEINIVVRRWIAFRVSLVLAPISSTHSDFTVEKILQVTGSTPQRISHDARAAIMGLLAEFKMNDQANPTYGHMGPADYYMD
ncbi:hypothetical protein [Streptomyces sp. SR-10]|uniref:hypothetical protein n=1 Tax=Streptomyces sp. SR-10 TaxID=3416442 RepID=UPI003CE708F8